MRLAFGNCVFDSDLRVLVREGKTVHLSPKAFRLLELLLERRPRPVPKDEILSLVWPDAFVSEGSLANLVAEIRSASGDDTRNPRYVRTVHRFGYAFCADAIEAQPLELELTLPARFRLVSPNGEFPLGEGEWLIGRASDCHLCLDSNTVSRHHARLRVKGEEVVLEDLGSKNGTFVGDEPVAAPIPLSNGDLVRFGSVRMAFRVFRPQSSTDSCGTRVNSLVL